MFDINKPIDTPTSVNAIDLSRPTGRILRVTAPLATVLEAARVRGHLRKRPTHVLDVAWRGEDRYSGVATFAVYAAVGKSGFRVVLPETTSHHGRFVCTPGRNYRFYVVADSAVGNRELGHSRPSAPATCR